MKRGSALTVRDLEVGYGRRGRDFSLRVPHLELSAGQVVALLGPNGAGKSTLLRAMAGLLPLRRGSVAVSAGRGVSLVFQRPVLMRGSVAYNVDLPLWARGLPRVQRRDRVGRALAHFEIDALAERDAATLSGGEARRVALARAFVTEPDVLLLDEPFDDLDAVGREGLVIDLRRAIEATEISVALVTHDLRQALLLADQVAVLRAGRLVQDGTRDQVLRRPATPEIAWLVGMTNLLPGTVGTRDVAGLARIDLGPRAQLRAVTELPAGAEVWVGIRPEHIKLDLERDDVAPIGSGVVADLVSDGALVSARIRWNRFELRTHLLAGRGLGHTLKRGDGVWLTIRPEDVHVMSRIP